MIASHSKLPGPGARVSPTVLVIEDHAPTTRALALALGRGGFESRVCHNGQEALETLHTQRPAAVLVDVHLPDISGIDLTKKMRKLIGEQIPIVVMSGDTSMNTLSALPKTGANYFLPKPINVSHLMEQLTEWIRLKQPETTD